MTGLLRQTTELNAYQLRGYDYSHAGMFGQFFGAITLWSGYAGRDLAATTIGITVLVLGTIVTIIGFARFARYFDRPRAWALLGLLNLIGYLTLHFVVRNSHSHHSGREGFEVVHVPQYVRDVWRMDVKVCIDPSTGIEINEEIQLQLPRGATVKAAMTSLAGIIPSLHPEGSTLKYRVNEEAANLKTEMSNGDRLLVSAS